MTPNLTVWKRTRTWSPERGWSGGVTVPTRNFMERTDAVRYAKFRADKKRERITALADDAHLDDETLTIESGGTPTAYEVRTTFYQPYGGNVKKVKKIVVHEFFVAEIEGDR